MPTTMTESVEGETRKFGSLDGVMKDVVEMLKPSKRLKVSESAEAFVYLHTPGGFSGWFRNDPVPYLVEPMDSLGSREHAAVCLVAPAQSGKTQVGVNWMAHSVVSDPADMLIIQTTRVTARDFSRRRIDRLHRYSPEIRERLLPSKQDDNTFDKFYRAGNIVSLGWPSISELSGRPIPRCFLTDYDRMPEDIEGEGSPFSLARARNRSFMSKGMTLVESSPGGEVIGRTWIPETAHEAPPTTGILGIYNQGDRRRWYWPDPNCEQWFEPTFDLLVWDNDETDIVAACESVQMACPHCGSTFGPAKKTELNRAGVWLREGQRIESRTGGGHAVIGDGRRSNIASFWYQGVVAAFQTWPELVQEYLQAMSEFDRTGNTEPLKTTVQQSQGKPFRPPIPEGQRRPEELLERAEPLGERVVPDGVRMLLPAVDVQKGKFVVQVLGIGRELESWLIDRYSIIDSRRLDSAGKPRPLDPASYPEDWGVILDQVIRRGYPLADGSGRLMMPILSSCDSGGEAGVTENAYAFWRELRETGDHRRLMLVKGDGRMSAPRIRMSKPDHDRSDRKARAAGVPVWLLNVNMLKDGLANDLARQESGRGYIHFPEWLPDWFYGELCAEERTEKGWQNSSGDPNEGGDLLVYSRASSIRLGVERIDWDAPPAWAAEWDRNPFVVDGVGGVTQSQPFRRTRRVRDPGI